HAERPERGQPYSPTEPSDKATPRTVERPLSTIALDIAARGEGAFRVLQYPPAMTLLYWFVDAVDRLDIPLATTHWKGIVKWVGQDFARQMSLTSARH